MGLLFQLPRPKNDMVTVLEELLPLAYSGPITGLLIIAKFPDGIPRIGIAGRYLYNPDALLAAIKKAEHKAVWAKSNLR